MLLNKSHLKTYLRTRTGYVYEEVDYVIDQAQYLLPFSIVDEEIFINLLTYVSLFKDIKQRTLQASVKRLRTDWNDLEGIPVWQPQSWFDKIQTLCDNFNWDLVGPIFLTSLKGVRARSIERGDEELVANPKASFCIVSGAHSSLAAMTKLSQGLKFRPVEAVLVLPRIDYY